MPARDRSSEAKQAPTAAGGAPAVRDLTEQAAALLRVLAHPTRLQILESLLDGPQCVKALNEPLPVSQPLLSQHMAALRGAGLVAWHARGNLRCYYLARPGLVRGLVELLRADHPESARPREEVMAEAERLESARRGRGHA